MWAREGRWGSSVLEALGHSQASPSGHSWEGSDLGRSHNTPHTQFPETQLQQLRPPFAVKRTPGREDRQGWLQRGARDSNQAGLCCSDVSWKDEEALFKNIPVYEMPYLKARSKKFVASQLWGLEESTVKINGYISGLALNASLASIRICPVRTAWLGCPLCSWYFRMLQSYRAPWCEY